MRGQYNTTENITAAAESKPQTKFTAKANTLRALYVKPEKKAQFRSESNNHPLKPVILTEKEQTRTTRLSM